MIKIKIKIKIWINILIKLLYQENGIGIVGRYHESGIDTRRKAAPQMTKGSHQAPTQEEESELGKSGQITISSRSEPTWPPPRSPCGKLRNALLLSSQWRAPLETVVIGKSFCQLSEFTNCHCVEDTEVECRRGRANIFI